MHPEHGQAGQAETDKPPQQHPTSAEPVAEQFLSGLDLLLIGLRDRATQR
nr:hypothetical protein [Enemella dayhoffiae]